MNAHRLAATLRENGTLMLEGLPFQAGETVDVIILEQVKASPSLTKPSLQSVGSQQSVSSDSLLEKDYLSAISETMTEWDSEADELAYQDL